MVSPVADTQRAGWLTVDAAFRTRVRRDPRALAIEAGTLRRSYAELDARAERLAAALQAGGVGHGDRVAILSENRAEYVELQLAAARMGAIVACQNWRLTPRELRHCLDLVAPRLIFVSPRHAATLAGLAPDAPVVELGPAYEAMLAGAPALAPVEIGPEDGLLILYTSGTTGMPKGALISQRAEVARMMILNMDIGMTGEDSALAWAPMFHMGSSDQMLAALMLGSAVIVVDGFDVPAIVDAIARHRLGWLLLMPGSIEPVLAGLRETGTVARGVKAVGAMPDLMPLKQIAELSGILNAPFLNSFGSTETGLAPLSGVKFLPGEIPRSLSKRQSSICSIRLVDEAGRDVPDGEAGELAIRGPSVFSGYWNAAETNARDFADGWFRLGDMFRRNPDDSFDFMDRAKYMIKSGGENIYPAEIERVLLADARIADAVVVRRADATWGEVPVAFVACHGEPPEVEQLLALCRAELAGYKRPKEIRFVAFEALPRSTTGKILRHEVEKWL